MIKRRPQLLTNRVAAVVCSDIHLSLKKPLARSEEKCWLRAMNRVLLQVKGVAKKNKAVVLCGGDVFDKWNASPELINWALDHLPHMYAVPGNHDLPTHRHDLSHRSAYGTLVRAGKITELGPKPVLVDVLALYGRPFDAPIPERVKLPADDLGAIRHVLVTHEYIWTGKHRYAGAPKDRKLGKLAKQFRNFDVVCVGDNHRGFLRQLGNGTWVMNTGTLLRRKADEINYTPRVGLIHENGEVSQHFLKTHRDQINRADEDEEWEDEAVTEFVDALQRLDPTWISFKETLMRELDRRKVSMETRQAVVEAME